MIIKAIVIMSPTTKAVMQSWGLSSATSIEPPCATENHDDFKMANEAVKAIKSTTKIASGLSFPFFFSSLVLSLVFLIKLSGMI